MMLQARLVFCLNILKIHVPLQITIPFIFLFNPIIEIVFIVLVTVLLRISFARVIVKYLLTSVQ